MGPFFLCFIILIKASQFEYIHTRLVAFGLYLIMKHEWKDPGCSMLCFLVLGTATDMSIG